jgi:hypothetical protein
VSRRRQRFVRIGSFFVLAFALMPAITYMGHWPLDSGHLHEETASTASSEDHELHCHAGLSHCAGSEAMVGSFWVGEDPDILSLTSPDRHVETHVDATALEGAPVRILQPPRAA